MDQRLPDPAVAAPPDWRGLCEELLRELENTIAVHYGEGGTHHISAADAVIAKADAALAQPEPEVVGPARLRTERRTGPFGEWNALVPCDSHDLAQPEPEVGSGTRLATHADGTPMISIGPAADMDTIARLAATPADGPAVPNGREPASVVGEPSDEELLRAYGLAKRDYQYEGPIDDWPKRAERAATVAGLRAVLTRWGRPAPAPAGERQAAPVQVGMIPMEYADLDSGARIVSEPSEEGPGGCWVVLNSRLINPLTEFPTAEAAWNALQAAHALPTPEPQP